MSRAERARRAAAAANRAAARELVDRAAATLDLGAEASTRSTLVRLMLAMYGIEGSLNWRRGYVDRVRELLAEAGRAVPSGKVVRWYRSKLAENPMVFARCPLVDVPTLEELERKYLRP
ncbi:MAG: hypothetical protein R3E44_09175 [Paracoccaceae bacterium]